MERVLTSQILKLEKQNLRENDQKIKIQKLNQFLSEKLEAAITQSERRYMSHTTVGFMNQLKPTKLTVVLRAVVVHCNKFNLIDNVTKENIFDSDQISVFNFSAQGKSI